MQFQRRGTNKEAKLKRDDFQFIEELNENERAEPWLVLAVDGDYDYEFAPGREWLHVDHQTAGIGCHHHYLHALRLTPKNDAVRKWMTDISDNWFATNVGAFYPTLNEILLYRNNLQVLGFDCDACYREFEEGIYPIDLTKDSLARICSDELPDDLDSLVIWKNPMEQLFGLARRWRLYILGPNSD